MSVALVVREIRVVVVGLSGLEVEVDGAVGGAVDPSVGRS